MTSPFPDAATSEGRLREGPRASAAPRHQVPALPCSRSRVQRGEQAASLVVCVCCGWLSFVWISSTLSWRSRMLPATPCGRCFATTCGAHHSTSRWPDRLHQPSHLLPGIQHIYTRSRSQCKESRSAPVPRRAHSMANLLADRTAEACSIVRSLGRGFIVDLAWKRSFTIPPARLRPRAGNSVHPKGLT